MPIRKPSAKTILLAVACALSSMPVLASPTPDEIALRSSTAIELQRKAIKEFPWQHFSQSNELLEKGEYAQYEAVLKRYLSAWKDDPSSEYNQHLLFELINSHDPNLLYRLGEWITKKPSAIAFLVRGAYLNKRGQILRGNAPTSATPALNLEMLAAVHLRALTDLQQAIRLDPGLLPAYSHLLEVAKFSPGLNIDSETILAMATQHHPLNVGARRRYLDMLSPDSGGSFKAMESFTETLDALAETNALLWTLKAQVYYERGKSLPRTQTQQKITELSTALRYANFNKYLEARGLSYLALNRFGDAIADLERCVLTEDLRLRGSEPHTNCKTILATARVSARDSSQPPISVEPSASQGEKK